MTGKPKPGTGPTPAAQRGPSLDDLVTAAKAKWAGTSSASVMGTRLDRCVAHLRHLGGPTSSPKVWAGDPGSIPSQLLTLLRDGDGKGWKPLGPGPVQAYYAALKSALRISGIEPVGWLRAPKQPRTIKREPMSDDDQNRLAGWLDAQGFGSTADLVILLRTTGMRVAVEGLSEGASRVSPGDHYDTLQITGKGQHERLLPVVDGRGRALLADPERMGRIRGVAYKEHLKRWNAGVKALGIKSKLATPHSVRHSYASDALRLSGGNVKMVQELLGHGDIRTTQRYLHVDLSEKAKALSSGNP